MSQGFRQPEILDLARRDGKVVVEDLAERFGVTLQTIRRDLTELARAGELDRVHGGAVLPARTTNIGYEDRRDISAAAKAAIGRAVAAEIPDDCALFLNIGTTTEAVARALLAHRNLLVVTNNMNVAGILSRAADIDVTLTGGSLRRSDGGLVGPLAAATIREFRLDFAVVGCSAIDAGGDLLDYDLQEVEVSRAILAHARRSLLVADGTKFERTAPARIGTLAGIDTLFTDGPVPEPLHSLCAGWRTRIRPCPVDGTG